ncbi:MAG: hydrogenase maturation nickel metallochaperone HypA [Nitrolancea sp.]
MHELSVTSYLVDAVDKQARELGAKRVVTINVIVGERSGIVDDSLRFYLEMLSPGTLVEGAELVVQRTSMRFYCAACDEDYHPEGANFECPGCGAIGTLVDDGSDLLIESLEIET